ncbi:methionine ABC transporter permease [Streptomyces polyrhachis]|uniref:Methionine ABC transporter permease n=1 Tax=Streptomyces polyrhachis TaxID=1282885 RepID=A0ABW2GD80_9ACTN
MTWETMRPLLETATGETLLMVAWSTLLAVLGGVPLGVLLVLTDRGGALANAAVNRILGAVVNLGRSLPFIILLFTLIPLTKAVMGLTTGTATFIGTQAMIVPLSVGAIPFYARLVETSVREVDRGLVEAVQSMGGSTWTVVRKVLLPQSLPSLTAGATTTVIALIGYSAMAGVVGGGGLGNLAYTYGYQRFETGLMTATVAALIALVAAIQLLGDLAVRRLARTGAPAPVRRPRPRLPRLRKAAP